MTIQYKKIKINAALFGHRKGDVISIAVDEEGIPLTKFWRDRLKDSVIDNCITVIEEKEQPSKK